MITHIVIVDDINIIIIIIDSVDDQPTPLELLSFVFVSLDLQGPASLSLLKRNCNKKASLVLVRSLLSPRFSRACSSRTNLKKIKIKTKIIIIIIITRSEKIVFLFQRFGRGSLSLFLAGSLSLV